MRRCKPATRGQTLRRLPTRCGIPQLPPPPTPDAVIAAVVSYSVVRCCPLGSGRAYVSLWWTQAAPPPASPVGRARPHALLLSRGASPPGSGAGGVKTGGSGFRSAGVSAAGANSYHSYSSCVRQPALLVSPCRWPIAASANAQPLRPELRSGSPLRSVPSAARRAWASATTRARSASGAARRAGLAWRYNAAVCATSGTSPHVPPGRAAVVHALTGVLRCSTRRPVRGQGTVALRAVQKYGSG
jgi:hypothetical protein